MHAPEFFRPITNKLFAIGKYNDSEKKQAQNLLDLYDFIQIGDQQIQSELIEKLVEIIGAESPSDIIDII